MCVRVCEGVCVGGCVGVCGWVGGWVCVCVRDEGGKASCLGAVGCGVREQTGHVNR